MNQTPSPETQIPRLLSRSLAPTEAPEALWSAVAARITHAPPRSASWRGLAMAAAIAALMTGGVLYLRAQQPRLHTPEQVALDIHKLGSADGQASYTVRREVTITGVPVTLVAAPATNISATAAKIVRTTYRQGGELAVSEWTHAGRRWVMVVRTPAHAQACQICHRA
ncbi:MAG: hypothetical protein FJW31_26805 [Acidobacteria bacterium]|nr:hypothetical protein [Acidobacteriota bacterium]